MNSLLGIAAYGPLGFMGYMGDAASDQERAKQVAFDFLTGGSYSKLMAAAQSLAQQQAVLDGMVRAGIPAQLKNQYDEANAAFTKAYGNYVQARAKYNELVTIAQTALGTIGMRSYAPEQMTRYPGLGFLPAVAAVSAVEALLAVVGIIGILLALGALIDSLRGNVVNSEGPVQNFRKAFEAFTQIPQNIGEGFKRGGEGFEAFGRGLQSSSTGLIQIAIAAAIGYGIYLLVKKGRRSAGATAPTTTALSAPALKTVEGTVIS